MIGITSLNICLGRLGGLELVLQVLPQGNVRVGILQEDKLKERIHTWQRSGFMVWAMEAEIRHQGVVAVAWQEEA